MVYVANDGRYIIKDRSITLSMDLPGNIEIVYPTDNFECDDLIAPAVAELLKHGYQTKYCCQGHIAPDLQDDTYTVEGSDIPVVEEFMVNRATNYYLPYIMFDKSVTRKDLVGLPSSWYIKKGKTHGCITIEAKFSNIKNDAFEHFDYQRKTYSLDYFDFQRRMIEYSEDLYNWARDLPTKRN